MSFFNKSIKTLLLIITVSFFSSTIEAEPEYRYHICPNTSTFTPNTTYQTNLNILLSSLVSNATAHGGFYNATAGRNDTVYGSFVCRGDLDPADCRDCVAAAAALVVKPRFCPVQKTAVVWYAECTLRYSNESFFGDMDNAPRVMASNSASVDDPERFMPLLDSALNESVAAAAKGNASAAGADRYFATREVRVSAARTLYSLVQCTPDLSSSECGECLGGALALIPTCCDGKQGGNVLLPSCNIRYELYKFYGVEESAPSPAPGFSPPADSATQSGGNDGKVSAKVIAAICAPIAAVLLLISIGCYWRKRRTSKKEAYKDEYFSVHGNPDNQNAENEIITNAESLQYDLGTIQLATNYFSEANKVGEGGFGTVYKGILSNGKEIAVKRLSRTSLQGSKEFKNEVLVVAKLQHRNLTRLLGFCLEGEEKLLVYEFVPNKSLDCFLYDHLHKDQTPLDWTKRYKIIAGIARGILYLHEDSRLRIIHRDLKASNILLDAQMNPKISDFGMAKICGVDQTQGNTSRIVGTYGYMSPEYAFYGQFSVKSDVFSFGVLIIEIVTGKKSTRFFDSEASAEDLLSFAWKQWRDGTPLALVDPRLGDSYTASEVMRCLHIGLLCVQEDPADRPKMATIVLMFNSYSVTLPMPKQPAFFPQSRIDPNTASTTRGSDISTSKSCNDMSFTEMYPR